MLVDRGGLWYGEEDGRLGTGVVLHGGER